MAGQLKEVRNRIKSVQNTQQITKAMKMVSAAKLRKAQESIIQMRPYAKKLQEMLSNIVSGDEGGVSSDLATERNVEKVLLIVITSDRGLAGAYNTNVIKLAKQIIQQQYSAAHKREMLPSGTSAKKDTSILPRINLRQTLPIKIFSSILLSGVCRQRRRRLSKDSAIRNTMW